LHNCSCWGKEQLLGNLYYLLHNSSNGCWLLASSAVAALLWYRLSRQLAISLACLFVHAASPIKTPGYKV
jgi:hypothetical protein